MKFKVLVILSGFLVLTTLAVCVSVHAYNAWASISRNKQAGTISVAAGANGHTLISGNTEASVTANGHTWQKKGKIAPGNKAKVSENRSGPDDRSGSAHGYVSGYDPHNWHHKRTHDVEYSGFSKKITKDETFHVITPPE